MSDTTNLVTMHRNTMRSSSLCYLAILWSAVAANRATAADDLVIADFESDTYGEWTADGTAFGTGPAQGTLPNQMAVSGYLGERLVDSFAGGDDAVGTLTSPAFAIERDRLNFLIGGGGYAGETCLNLVIGGQTVRTATGPNTENGGSEALDWGTWDVKDLRGQQAHLQIVDQRKGGWGHINVDHVVQSDRGAQSTAADRTRELVLDQQYLLFPIQNGGPQCRMKLTVDGRVVHDFDINLATAGPDWWSHVDVSAHRGQPVTITVDRLPPGSQGLAHITAAAGPRHSQPLYDEALRPQLRFSQMQGWNNDPNGMVYHDGEYHFFWQSNPFGPKWGEHVLGPRGQQRPVPLGGTALRPVPAGDGEEPLLQRQRQHRRAQHRRLAAGAEPMVAAFTDTGAGEALGHQQRQGPHAGSTSPENPVIPNARTKAATRS